MEEWIHITADNYLTLKPGEEVRYYYKKYHYVTLTDDMILLGRFQDDRMTKILYGDSYVKRTKEIIENPSKLFNIKYRLVSVGTERVGDTQRILFVDDYQSQEYSGYHSGHQYVDEKIFDSEDDALRYVASDEGVDWQGTEFVILKIYNFNGKN